MQQETDRDELRRQLPLELARRLESEPSQLDRTTFMKLACLLQELYGVPLGYRFSLYVYGPYSPEAAGDLEHAQARQRAEGTQERNQNGAIGQYSNSLDSLVEHFGSLDARELELRTTSMFLWKRFKPQGREDLASLIETVRQLKPHRSAEDIRDAIENLMDEGIISYFPTRES